jgi:hypothetical protein
MKTLGQIAYESFVKVQGTDISNDARIQFSSKEEWEAAAQAVKAAVIEEAAIAMERKGFVPQVAKAIRSLQ